MYAQPIMATTTKKPTLTKLEEQFIIAFYSSVEDTLNYSRVSDVHMAGLTTNQVKGVFGSLVAKGVFKPDADMYEGNGESYETIGMTDLLSNEEMNEIAKKYGMYFDFEDMDYDYLKPLTKTK